MKTSVVRTIRILSASREERWRSAALLLALAMIAHHLAMSSPVLHDRLMPMPVAAMAHHDGGAGAGDAPCPAPCAYSCPVVEALFPLTALLMLMLLAIFTAVGAMLPIVSGKIRRPAWLWPQTRRRAFLQVFLC